MKIDVERLESCEAALTVEVEPERLERAMKSAARRLSEKNPLPGFRKGKAPYALVVRHFGEEYIRSEAIETLGQQIYEEALDQAEIDPYAAGSLNDITLEPLVYKFTVPLKPEVELGPYRSVRLAYDMPEVSDDDLLNALNHLREHQAVLEPVERPAELGDVVTIDVAGTLTDKDEPEFLLKDEGVSLLLDTEAEWPMPGFAEKLVGMAAGEEREIDMSFAEDYANESLKGRPAHYVVNCSAVKSRTLPEWDDALAKEIGDFETLDELRAAVRKQLQDNTETQYNNEYSTSVKDIVTAGATVNFPPTLLEREIENLAEDLDRRLREQNLNLEDYLKIENRTQESLREELRPRAVDRLKWALILGSVVEAEGLDLEAGEVEQRIQSMAQYFGKDGERISKALSSDSGKRSIALDLLTDKAVERLVAIAKGEAQPRPGDGETAESAADAKAEEAEQADEAESAEETAEADNELEAEAVAVVDEAAEDTGEPVAEAEAEAVVETEEDADAPAEAEAAVEADEAPDEPVAEAETAAADAPAEPEGVAETVEMADDEESAPEGTR